MLEGKAALVTGSARGIGRAAAALLAEHGARVLITDLDEDLAAARPPPSIGGDDGGLRRRPDEGGRLPRRSSQATVDAFGQLDIVVNNAGYTWDGIAHRMSDDQFRAMLEIHTVVPFRVLRAAAPHFREPRSRGGRGGREVFRKVVNVTSISGTQGNVGQANYSAAKAGPGRADEDARARVGPLQGERERRRVRLRRDAPDRRAGEGARRSVRRRRDPARDPRADARPRRRSSRSAAPRRPRRPRGRSSSSARPGRTSCTAR